jgi:Carboxypeptidase activation peptide
MMHRFHPETMTNRLLVLMVLALLPLWCSSKPLEDDVAGEWLNLHNSLRPQGNESFEFYGKISGADREMNEVTTLSSVDVDDAERRTESTTELWNSEMLRDEGVEHSSGQSPESPVGEISSDLPTTWEPVMEVTTEASPLSLSMEPQSAASDDVETESTTLMVDRMTEPNETSPEVTTMMDEMLVQDDQFTTQVMADDLVKMSEMNSSASAESDKADEGSSFLTDAEFTTQLPDYLFTDEVESTTQMELVTEDSTESATETATDAPMPSSEMPQPVHHVKRPLNKKKRSYEGYRVYRVILPTEESVQRILALEGEPGIDFWADPHLLLRPRGLFVTSAADIMASPKAIPLVEEVFRRSRLPFVVMVDNVQVKMASAVSSFRGKTLTFDVFFVVRRKLLVQKLISQENPSLAMTRKDLLALHGHSLTWQRYHRLGGTSTSKLTTAAYPLTFFH